MDRYRRIIEIDMGDGETFFKTIRVDVPDGSKKKVIVKEFIKLLEGHKGSYETQARFVEPKSDQVLGDYYPRQPGESFWEWLEDEDYEDI